jgi:transposase
MRLYPLPPAEPASTTRTYPSSLSDAEWAVLQPLVQRPATPQGGRPPKHPLRVIIDAIRYLVRTGCAWRLLPRDFPPPGTGYWWFAKWAADGTLERIHDGLRERVVWQPVAEQRRRRGSSTPSRSARPIPCHGPAAAGTPARRSTAASGTWQWTPWGCCCRAGHFGLRAGPRRRPGATVAPARQPPEHPAGLGRWWLRRQAGRVGGVRAAPGGGDRTEAP